MISVIVPCLNEKDWILNKTIQSIKDTSDAEIIVVNDSSDKEPILENKDIIYESNKFRLGAAQSKHLGVCLSSRKHVFLTDSHVIFEKGWYEEVLKSLENKPNTLYCGSCLGLGEDYFDLSKFRGKYTAADLFLYDDSQVLDGKWAAEKPEKDYEISCVMGANYFMHKSHFFKIRGYADLKAWGSEEPCLSIKTFLSGGEVRINKDVRIGHMFRDSAPYSTELKYVIYNKIRMILSFFEDEEIQNKLIDKIPNDHNKIEAIKLISNEEKIINDHKKYYKSIFTRDMKWLCNKFNIKYE